MSVKMLPGIKIGGEITYIGYTDEICEYVNSYSSFCILLCLYNIAISNKILIGKKKKKKKKKRRITIYIFT